MRVTISGDLVDGERTPIDSVLKTYHQRLKRLWRNSVKAFIMAIIDAMHIDTGMSVASLQPLAAQVRLRTIILETLRGKGPRRGYVDLQGVYHREQFKSRAHGERLGRQAYQLSFGTPQHPDLRFEFDIVVFQHQYHEPTWDSLQKGQEAFINYFETNFNAIVRVDDLVGHLVLGI